MSARDLDQILCCPHGCEAERGETCGAATVGPEIRAALSAAGWVVVPREPTVEQFEAARERDEGIILNENGTVPYSGYALIYRAMIAAAQEAADA